MYIHIDYAALDEWNRGQHQIAKFKKRELFIWCFVFLSELLYLWYILTYIIL